MTFRKVVLLPLIFLFSFTSVILASGEPKTSATEPYPNLVNLPRPQPAAPTLVPEAPSIDAKGYILIDANSGKILAAKNIDERMQPASLTKLMSLYIISKALQSGQIHLNDNVTISEKAWKTGGSRMFIKAGDQVTVNDLIQGIIVDSGNDACVAMAEQIAGSEEAFASLMNQQAQKLGMTNSHFVESTGLPNDDHYSTPRDLAILARALIKDFPNDYTWYKQKWFTYNKIKQPNRNRLLWWDTSIDGLKTGHTKDAGYCLIASAKRHGMRLISVVMGTPTDNARAADSQKLLNYGFRFYETHKLYAANTELAAPRIWKGADKHVAMGLAQDLYVTIPAGSYNKLKASVTLQDNLQAPILKGQAYGKVEVNLDDKPYVTLPLVALQDDPKGGIFRRMIDSVSLTFHRVF